MDTLTLMQVAIDRVIEAVSRLEQNVVLDVDKKVSTPVVHNVEDSQAVIFDVGENVNTAFGVQSEDTQPSVKEGVVSANKSAEAISEEPETVVTEGGDKMIEPVGFNSELTGPVVSVAGDTLSTPLVLMKNLHVDSSVGPLHVPVPFDETIRKSMEGSWHRCRMEIDESTDTTRRSGWLSTYDLAFFRDLMTPRSWLTDDHIQECGRGLLHLQKTYPSHMVADVALMDINLHQLLLAAYNEWGMRNISGLMTYVRAELPHWPSIPWDKARLILIPFHIASHWVLLKCVPKIRKIIVMDSDHSVDRSGKKLFEKIKPFALMIPHLFVALGTTDDLETEWNIVRPNDYPKKKTSGECGMYVLAASASTMSLQGNAYKLNDEIVYDFRRYFTCCLWDNCWWLE